MGVSIWEGKKAERVAKALERLAGDQRIDQTFEAMLDGTNTSKLFAQWWPISGEGDDTRWRRLERWFEMLARAWAGKYYTLRFADYRVSGDPAMTPMADLAGKSPAGCYTETDANTFEWADEDPMTWYVRANALSLADGTMNILAVEGVDNDFDVTGEMAPVYTFSLALWMLHFTDGTYEYKSFATQKVGGMRPCACDVAPDGSKRVMTWHATFGGRTTTDGKLTSGAGKRDTTNRSASAGLTDARRWNAYEGTYSDTDRDWLLDMWQLRHFNLENSGILEGCTNYNLDYTVAMAEEGVRSFAVTAAQGANILIGSVIDLGSAARNASVARGKVERKEDFSQDDVAYTRVYLDVDADFDVPDETHAASMPWYPGSTEALPGHKDGSLYNCTNGKTPARIAGVEVLDGAYSLGLDPLWMSDYNAERSPKSIYTVYQCRDSERQASSVTADYEAAGTFQSENTGWQYVKHFAIVSNGMLIPDALGGSSTTYLKSAFLFHTSSGVRALWAFGNLNNGGNDGVACADGNNTPGNANWNGWPRITL